MALSDGLYDQILTIDLERALSSLGPGQVDVKALPGGGVEYLVDLIARQLGTVLDELPVDDAEAARRQVELVNGVLIALRERLRQGAGDELPGRSAEIIDLVASPLRVLRAVRSVGDLPQQPELGLAVPWLFTAGKGSPSLLHEIRRELSSSDRVDILVSFITMSGVRKLQDVLHRITAQGSGEGALALGGTTSPRLRVLTTTYTGATEARALDELARLPGCEVRVSLDGRRTRLHAKAWLFHRSSGFGSAYIGSANLSGAALTGGLEWTVKVAQRSQPALFARAEAHFETLWSDTEFQRYDPDDATHRKALADALGQETFGSLPASVGFFDLHPKTYQQDMLEQLAGERSHGRARNLVVAATGTGKTVVAAFDYRATCHRVGGRPRLLFVAHREEILRQALRTFREVLRDPEFGDLFTGGHDPQRSDHLFATIDIVTTRNLVALRGDRYWHTVVIDECHRLAADRFDAFATAVAPSVLLGLTATPERSDGQPIARYFDMRPDGGPAVELRLWHALDLQLLAPFEYYACDDETDFSSVPWDMPGERAAVDNLVTGNDIRARLVVREWERLSSNARQSKAIVFCVSVAHAEFMTRWLNRAGLPAACVVGTTPREERLRAPQRLERGELCALVTVDLYNEGVDLPMIDTLLLLRPTQSPVLFQQQLGRGLRLFPGKESCLVLDFVGQHRRDFRFDRLLSSMTGLSRGELEAAVAEGFGSLPPGCHIHLQRQTREQVLASLRNLPGQSWQRMVTELQAHVALRGRTPVRLGDFLHHQGLELEDVYRSGTGTDRTGWTNLKRAAGLMRDTPSPEEPYLSRRAAALIHVDDPLRLDVLSRLFDMSQNGLSFDPRSAAVTQMIAYQIDGRHGQVGDHIDFVRRMARNPANAQEFGELGHLLQARTLVPVAPVPGLDDLPLCLHASYDSREILTSVGWLTPTRRSPFQAGVLPLAHRKTELLFVTLDKSDAYHDRVAYHDYAVSTDRFHWQSQNSAGPATRAGRRYLESASNGWQFQLFVRVRKGAPYRACGPVLLESAEGGKPMSIMWRLEVPLPTRLFREFSILRDV